MREVADTGKERLAFSYQLSAISFLGIAGTILLWRNTTRFTKGISKQKDKRMVGIAHHQ
jgi:hypothetical protein